MSVSQHTEHAEGAVVLDEAHAAHVGRQLKDRAGSLDRLAAVLFVLQIQAEIFDAGDNLVPLVQGLDVDGADLARAAGNQILDQMTANKASRTANDNFLIFDFHGLNSLSGIPIAVVAN